MRRSIYYILTVIALVLAQACSPARLAEQGKTAKAFERAANQLERNPTRKASVGATLASTYKQLQRQGASELSMIYNSTAPQRWEHAVTVLEELQQRRQRVNAIRSSSTRVIRLEDFNEADYETQLVHAKSEAAAQLLREAKNLYASAKLGDRYSAREAYEKLQRRTLYADDTKEVVELRYEAKQRGTVYVALRTYGQTSHDELHALGLAVDRVMSQDWVNIAPVDAYRPREPDLLIELDAASPDVGLKNVSRVVDIYKRDIVTQVKVGVDSTGKAIFEDRVEKVQARVVTICVERRAEARATLALIDIQSGRVLRQQEACGRYVYEDCGTEVSGDSKALKGQSINYLNKRVSPAPAGDSMAARAQDALRAAIPAWDLEAMLPQGRMVRN